MNPMDAMRLKAAYEDDLTRARRWWDEHDDEARALICERIQAMGSPEDVDGELIARFARLGAALVALKAADPEFRG